ncbi:MAG: ABC transporter ATP-binding protein [Ruminococcaceae bacterium]|nr:ABC transporter ATP-binding protein [Oscillospiraceae bacterium]
MADNQKKIAVISRILRYIRKYIALVCLSLFLAVVSVVSSLAIPVLVGSTIDFMIEADRVDFGKVSMYLCTVLLCTGVCALSQWLMSQMNNRITFRVSRDIRNEAFRHIQKLPLSYLDQFSQGDIVSRVIVDVDTFADGLLMGFTQFFTGVLTILGTLLFMLITSWQIALVVVLVTPLSLLVASFIAKSTYNMFRTQTEARGAQTALIDETVGGIKVVQAFGHEKTSLEVFDKSNELLEKSSLKAIFFSSLTNPSTRFVNSLVYAGVGLVGALMAIGGGITVGNLTSFLNYANQYTKPFNEISGVVTELQNAIACAGRVFELLDAPEMTPDPEMPAAAEDVAGRVDIRSLSFSYTKEKPLLQNIDLTVSAGQKIAIVGPTGCGKTTFINLLMRFYDPDQGRIYIDGVDTQTMRRETLRSCIGMVLQDTWLKNATIRENIAMGRPEATEEEIIEAAKQARVHSFISRLPKGYDTVIGELGGDISQGQKQLLCIARLMLCLPPMLILDEATSSIDTRTEMQVQKAFDTLMQGRTSFVVAHRLSTIQEADCILVMENGNIVEQGKHAELLEKKGLYAKLYESQFAH